MGYLIQINNVTTGIKPVYARRSRLNAEQVHRSGSSNLKFRGELNAVDVLGTDYFHQAGLIGPGNRIAPARLWEHLGSIEKAGALHDFSFVGIRPRATFKETESTITVKNEIFHAVIGRLIDTDGDYFTSKYPCSKRYGDEIDIAIISLFKYGERAIWDKDKPIFDHLGLRIDLTGAVFLQTENGYDGINLDNAVLANSTMFYKSFKGAFLRGAFMQGAKLSLSDFSGADLTGSDLQHAGLSHTNFAGSCLAQCDLTEAEILFTNFSGADMTSATIVKPSRFKDAVFENTDLAWATMQNFMQPALAGFNVQNAEMISWISR